MKTNAKHIIKQAALWFIFIIPIALGLAYSYIYRFKKKPHFITEEEFLTFWNRGFNNEGGQDEKTS